MFTKKWIKIFLVIIGVIIILLLTCLSSIYFFNNIFDYKKVDVENNQNSDTAK